MICGFRGYILLDTITFFIMSSITLNHSILMTSESKSTSKKDKDLQKERRGLRIPSICPKVLKAAIIVDNRRAAVEVLNISDKGMCLKTKERYVVKESDPIIVHLYFYDTVVISYHLKVKYTDSTRIGAVFSENNNMSGLMVFKNFVSRIAA